MPLPLLVVLGLSLAGGGGAFAGGAGGVKWTRANRIICQAEESQAPHLEKLLGELALTREALTAYGELKIRIDAGSLQRMRDYIVSNGRKVDPSAIGAVDDLRVDLPDLDDPQTIRMARDLLGAAVGSVVSGAAARAAILALVAAYGTASTGTSIAALSGVAATNATLAFLGGGALAAGGGGVAAGGLVLGGVAAAPGVLITGLTLLIQGERRKTAAKEFEARVAVRNEELDASREAQPAVRARVRELADVATTLDHLLGEAMDDLEGRDLNDSNTHSAYWRAILIATTLSKLLQEAVVTQEGFLNPSTGDHIRNANGFRDPNSHPPVAESLEINETDQEEA